ncbi:MAG: PAS domain S-box protein [Candidatus Melainabacteria bacterium]|nr:PAS domain S-box protein [Candidatus Melainabacteria bacterium]
MAVPVVIEVGMVAWLLHTFHQSEEARKQLIESRQMVGHINALLSLHLQRTQLMFLTFAKLVDRDDHKIRELNFRQGAEVKVIAELSSHSERKTAEWQHLKGLIFEIQDGFETLRQYHKSGDKMSAMMLLSTFQKTINDFYSEIDQIVRQESAADVELQRQLTENNDRLVKILCASLAVIVVTAVAAAIYVNTRFTRRLDILMQNTRRMSAGLAPVEPIQGEDELAQIDSVYHQMHNALEVLRKHERAMLENAAEAICSLDAGLSFTSVNKATEKIWEYEADELMARRVIELIADKDKEKFSQELSAAVGSESEFRTETKIKRKNGEICDTAWSISWSKEEGSLYCVVQDITQRKELEQMKQDFFAMVNHDLRTPLTSVQMVLDWVEIEMGDEMPDNLLKAVKRAKGSSQEMLTLANSLLEMERLDSGTLSLDIAKTDIAELLRTSMAQVEALAIPKKIELKAELSEVSAEIDKSRILQVTTNILTNAVKFSPNDSTVTVSLVSLGDTCKVTIKDQGVGIAEEDLKFVFERFRQAGGADGRKQGFGLGLSICKSIVEAHGGQIGVQSEEGKGSTFWFILNTEAA